MSSETKAVNVLIDAITKGAVAAADSKATDTTRADIGVITSKVLSEVAPVVLNATNNEPWYQSRVTLGAILGGVAGLVALAGWSFPEEVQGKVVDAIVTLAPLIGMAITLYGRWRAKKPLGQ